MCSAKEVKDNANIYTTENRRIPQNLMRVGKADWFSIQERVLYYTMNPLLGGKLFRNFVNYKILQFNFSIAYNNFLLIVNLFY